MGSMFSSPAGAAPDLVTDSHHRFEHDAPQPCQAPAADHDADDMNPEERAYHEGFMREAISMVNSPRRQPVCVFKCAS